MLTTAFLPRRAGPSRGGFTLVELLASMVMLAIVGNAILALVVAMQRITRQQSEIAAMQGSLRSGYQLLQTELVELAPADLTSLAGDQLGYRAMRGLGESCEVTGTAIALPKSSYSGLRAPTAERDGVWLYLDGDSTRSTDDQWIALPLTDVSAGTCPGGAEAWVLTVSIAPEDLARAVVPGPIRTFEEMEIGQVAEGGQQWLGIRSIGFGEAVLAPVTGPVAWNGVRFSYLDGSDSPTATASQVRSIVVTVRGVTERPVRIGNGDGGLVKGTDSLELRIRLRN